MDSSIVSVRPKALVGLGNPDPRLRNTRHNIGFDIIDTLAAAYGGQWHRKDSVEVATIVVKGHQVLLVKPQTYMNNSGDAVPFLKKHAIKPEEALVIHDELELPLGRIVFKQGGSAKGHNGIKSLMERWGTDGFVRLRFGIGRPVHKNFVSEYVLQRFEDSKEAERLIYESVNLIEQLFA
ncbi:aminoacyl-tRNA hydrolase [Candidatus Dependentiae bacterium]|nr:aminoacyl-tRNA hydrolase [Candidatus Dependentiae bacterium]